MTNKATEVLEKQISKVKEEITKSKLDIADLFIKIHRLNPLTIKEPAQILDVIEEMDKMPKYLDKLSKSESKLEVLSRSKSEIEEICLS